MEWCKALLFHFLIAVVVYKNCIVIAICFYITGVS